MSAYYRLISIINCIESVRYLESFRFLWKPLCKNLSVGTYCISIQKRIDQSAYKLTSIEIYRFLQMFRSIDILPIGLYSHPIGVCRNLQALIDIFHRGIQNKILRSAFLSCRLMLIVLQSEDTFKKVIDIMKFTPHLVIMYKVFQRKSFPISSVFRVLSTHLFSI